MLANHENLAADAPSVCAVIVTFNRLDLLQAAIAAVRQQTRRPERIVVVDNGSTDGTPKWLQEQVASAPEGTLHVLSQANRGSAGGFAAGIEAAFRAGNDSWLWCMDDDTVPEPDCLERMLAAAERFSSQAPSRRLGWMNSVIRWSDGALHRMNEPRLTPFLEWPADVAQSRYLPARWCSYVSVMVSREAVRTAGLPLRDLFIWYDDVEWTERISQRGFQGLLVLDSFAEHRTKLNYAPDVEDLSEANIGRFRYAFRNEVVFLRTVCQSRGVALRFVRLVLRRLRLMIAARKWRYLPDALIHAWRGLFFPRHIEFPEQNAAIHPAPAVEPVSSALSATRAST